MENPSQNSSRWHEVPAWILLAAGLLLTCLATFYVYWNVHREDLTRFNDFSDEVVTRIRSRVERYRSSLLQTRGFFASHRDHAVTRKEFHDYISNLDMFEIFPGIQGVGYAPKLTRKEVSSLERKVRREGFPKYRVWPSEPRKDYFPIVFIEPFDLRNQRAFGFDMFTEQTRHEAMERAWLTGDPAASGRVVLVQEAKSERQPGFLIYVPIYRPDLPVRTVEERKKALTGFAYSPFRTKDLFQAIFRGHHLPIDFEVFDGSGPSEQTLLYDSNRRYQFGNFVQKPRLSKLTQIDVAGRTWTIYTSATTTFVTRTALIAPVLTALSGLLISFLLFRIFQASGRHGAQLQRLYQLEQSARRQTESSLSVLETLNRVSRNISAELDLQTLVQNVTDAATTLSNAQFGAFFYNVIDQKGESYTLFTISGAPREAFSKFPMPRNTEIFSPTFSGTGIVRSDDIRKDPRYGKNAPYYGMPKGHLPVVSYLAVPVVSRSGEVLGGLFFGHEKAGVFSEREETLVAGLAAQAAVAIDNARLFQRSREAIALRDEFLSICSHELKTPLTTLKLQTQMNRRIFNQKGSMPTERASALLSTTDRQVDRLSRLVDDMLDVSRIATGKLRMEFESFDIAALVREVAERMRPQLESASCDLRLEIGPRVMGQWDRFRIDQVVTNLITNAIKYGPGKPVHIGVAEEGGEARITVRDEGIGIAPEHHGRIFERFERAVGSDSQVGGLGLGLYITRQILEAQGGTIRVESEVGRGATFIVELPLEPARASEMSA